MTGHRRKQNRRRRISYGPREASKKKNKAAESPRVHRHGLYGEIPMLRRTHGRGTGAEWHTWEFDPAYEPPMPPGAVRGDILKQAYCGSFHVPRYFYVDIDKLCVQCAEAFVFGAAEQKFWYESLGFRLDSTAIRCRRCRRRQRTIRALNAQIAAVRRGLQGAPEDPSLLLSLAEALVRYHQRRGEGSLEDAVAAARKASKLWPENAEPLFWEGLALCRGGFEEKGSGVLWDFLRRAGKGRRRHRRMLAEAEALVAPEPAP